MFWHTLKDHIAQRASAVVDARIMADDVILSPRPELGDLAIPCFRFAKELGMNPAEVAKKIAAEFGADNRNVEVISAEGPFVNFTLCTGEFVHRVVSEVLLEKGRFGMSEGVHGGEILFEYAQPNTHKEMHVGHLRNLVLGSSLVRILRQAGYVVTPMSYHGDVGAHVAKCLWWLVERSRAQDAGQESVGARRARPSETASSSGSAMGLTIEEADAILVSIPRERQTGNFLGQLYTESTREVEKDPETKAVVSTVQQALEAHEPAWSRLWMETRRWSLLEFTAVFEELSVQIERQYLESEVVEAGQRMVDELLKKGIAQEDQGAVIVDLEDAGLGKCLIRKSDGTSLYATKDLALAALKAKEYPHAGRSIVLVDNRQSLYFCQLFEIFRRMGNAIAMEHVGYEFVTLKSGAMSSREGNIVTYQSFRDGIYEEAWKETKERHATWMEGQLTYVAWALTLSAMKFGMLRQDPGKTFVFNLEEALAFEGDTGPYVQYAAVRLGSILKKADCPAEMPAEGSCLALSDPQEKRLALVVAQFAETVARSAKELKPSYIAQWCIDAARASNAFYRDVKVLDAPDTERAARLRLVFAARRALALGLDLLGIPVPEEM